MKRSLIVFRSHWKSFVVFMIANSIITIAVKTLLKTGSIITGLGAIQGRTGVMILGGILLIIFGAISFLVSLLLIVAAVRLAFDAYTKNNTSTIHTLIRTSLPYLKKTTFVSLAVFFRAAWPALVIIGVCAALLFRPSTAVYTLSILPLFAPTGIYLIYKSIKLCFSVYEVILGDATTTKDALEKSESLVQGRFSDLLLRNLGIALVFWVAITLIDLAMTGLIALAGLLSTDLAMFMRLISSLVIFGSVQFLSPVALIAGLIIYLEVKRLGPVPKPVQS